MQRIVKFSRLPFPVRAFPLFPVLGALIAVALLSPETASAQPAVTFTASTPDATYRLRDSIPITVNIRNTVRAITAAAGAAANAANTARNVRITKIRLIGRDIYGNQVFICSTSYPLPVVNVNDLSKGLPDNRGSLAPEGDTDYTFQISIPNDGTLHDVTLPGYRVEVTLEWDIPAGGGGTLVRTTDANTLIAVAPNLQLPSVTCPPNPTGYRGGDVVRFNSFIRNSLTGDGTRQSRPMRSNADDRFRVVTHLTTDPGYGNNTPNDDDYQLYFQDMLGDLGAFPVPDANSEIRTIRVFDTPGAVPTYGDPDPALGRIPNATYRIYTPQPDDGFLDIGEVLNIEYDVLVPQNFPGVYFIAGMVDSLSQIDEPLGFNPPRESPPREAGALVNDNTFLDRNAPKFVISSTGNNNSPQVGLVSGAVDPSTGALTTTSNDYSDLAAVSGRGEVIAYVSYATNLATNGGVTNRRRHIYAQIRNPQSGAISSVLVSRATGANGTVGNGDSDNPMVSADGRFVVFESNASNLVPGDTNGQTDIFVRDVLLDTITRVSLSGTGAQATGSSLQPSISGDGRFVAFHSNARNLARNSTPARQWGSYQAYVVDRDTDDNGIFDEPGKTATFLASVNASGAPANAFTRLARISGDGKYLAYLSNATNLDPATRRLAHPSVYRVPLINGAPRRTALDVVSRASGAAGAVGNNRSYEVAINGDGQHIAFSSLADNLVRGDNNGVSDVFVRDYSRPRQPKTVRVSVSSERAATGTITVLGSLLAAPGNIPPNLVRAGQTVSFGPRNAPRSVFTFGGGGNNPAVGAQATVSRDNLVAAINTRIGRLGIEAEASTPVIPLPGFLASPTSYTPSIFLISRKPGTAGNELIASSPSMLVTRMAGGGTEANDPAVPVTGVPFGSSMPSISADGRFVAFRSVATNLDVYRPDPKENRLEPPRTRLRNGEFIRPLANGAGNVYVHDRQMDGSSDFDSGGNFGSTRVSVNQFGYRTTSLLNVPSSASSHAPSISANGQFIAFSSDAENNGGLIFGRTNLDPLDSNGYRDVFVMNRRAPGIAQVTPKLDQTIAFGALPSPRFGSATPLTIRPGAVATSRLPVTYTSSNPSIARVDGQTITILRAGTARITAREAGNARWRAAAETRTLTVRKGNQTIAWRPSLSTPSGYLFPGYAPRNSTVGLPVTYTSANPRIVRVTGNAIQMVRRGYTTVTARQRGDANWNPAPTVSHRIGRP